MIAFEWVIKEPGYVLLTGSIIPLITGFLTTPNLSGNIKHLITIGLNAIAALLTTTAVGGTAVISGQALATFIFSTALSYLSYYLAWKKLNITSSTPDGKLANIGVKAA